jgi:hypothetical protein
MGKPEEDQEFDYGPGGIDLARLEAELRAARKSVVVVVKSLTAGQ